MSSGDDHIDCLIDKLKAIVHS